MYRGKAGFHRLFGETVPLFPYIDKLNTKKLHGSLENTMGFKPDNNFIFFCSYLSNKWQLEVSHLMTCEGITCSAVLL